MSSLEGASNYLNNLLLARGLLQDGKMIDFAHPAHATGTTDATMAKVINLVHDLVLRRDRDSEQHEVMAASIRNLRNAESQKAVEFEHMQGKNVQLMNDATTAQAHERSIRATLRKMETQMKELKEQNLKMKSMLDQVRAKCTSDVRKRDVEIDKLKTHLTSLQRGKKEASGMKISTINLRQAASGKERRGGQDVNSADWSLEKETNDFLAALVNETSAENVSLRQVVNETIDTLKNMAGVTEEDIPSKKDGIGIPGQYRQSRQPQIQNLVPIEVLTEQMCEILEHCRSILRDPSFVPVEEVYLRDEEIAKLRSGWEKMADRWKEAVTMMSQWKQRLVQDGGRIDMTDFSDLSFGRSVAVRPDGQPVLSHDEDLSSIFEDKSIESLDDGLALQHDTDGRESDLELEPESEPALKRLASSPAKRGVRLPHGSRPLGETTGNSSTKPRTNGVTLQPSGLDGSSDIENASLALETRPGIKVRQCT